MTKQRNPLENPPAASSSDDDEVDSSLGEEEEEEDDASSSSEEEQDQPKPPSSSAVTIAIPGKTTLSSASDSGSETETDSESETKSILAAPKPKKDNSPPPPLPKSGTKRPSEGTSNETNSKRPKKIGEDSKKPAAFQRLWTEEDEIAVLQGMIDFKKDTGNSPYDDTNAYYDYIKKAISFEVSKNQFMDKLRSLKKKYMGKEKPSFTKPHDQRSYRLCKYIWGPDGMGLESAVKSNGVSKKSRKKIDSVKRELPFASSPNDGGDYKRVLLVHRGDVLEEEKYDWFENSFLVRAIAGLGVDEYDVKQRWRLVPVESKKRVEDKVKMLQAKEIEFVLEKTQILHEVTSMLAEASKNKPLE